MKHFKKPLLINLACCVLLSISTGCNNGKANSNTLASTQPSSLINKATKLGSAAATQKLELLVSLKGRNQEQLTQFLHDIYTPNNPLYHHFITPQEYTKRYAATPENVAKVSKYLTNAGMQVTHIPSNNAFIQVSATVAQVQALFKTKIQRYSLNSKTYYSNDSAASVSSDIAGMVTGVSGLDNFTQIVPAASVAMSTTNAYTPQQIQRAYGVDKFLQQNINGQNQTVLILLDGDLPIDNDVDGFNTRFNLPPCNSANGCFTKVNQYGMTRPTPSSAGSGYNEALIDVTAVHTIAPQAKIILMELPNRLTPQVATGLNSIISLNLSKIVSASFGMQTPEQESNTSTPSTLEPIFQQAAAQGISINFAAGDWGNTNTSISTRPNVVYPASSPWVTAVGGTNLLLYADGRYKSEFGWEDSTSSNGTSGGLSKYYTAQPWQSAAIGNLTAVGYLGLIGTRRAIPDISMIAENFMINPNGYWEAGQGDSFSAPLFSGLLALANQARAEKNLPPVGLVTEKLYSMAYSPHQGQAPLTSVISPLTLPAGGESSLGGGPHWNDITGLGSPYAPLFVQALANSN